MEEEKESKEARFRRIAKARTNGVLNELRKLGNCSNKSTYDYTPEQIAKIFETIERAVIAAKEKYERHTEGQQAFDFD